MKIDTIRDHHASTSAWATVQNRIFSGELTPGHALEFEPLRLLHEELCGPSNLSIRQHIIVAAFHSGDRRQEHETAAYRQFNALRRNGYWREQASYWAYTNEAFDWWIKLGIGFPLWAAHETTRAYMDLATDNGSIPMPECREGGWPVPVEIKDVVDTPSYYCRRWKDAEGRVTAYLLIALDANPEPRRNLHAHLTAGYFALWGARTGWVQRCRPYTGFHFLDSFESRALAETLPKGAMPKTWRAKPPTVTVEREVCWAMPEMVPPPDRSAPSLLPQYSAGVRFSFTWNNGLFGTAYRTIEIYPDRVVVKDKDAGLFKKWRVREWKV